jgi:predicted nuclease of predicted toxin-antitoxin system
MKLLFDQNISHRILKKLPPELSECTQVRFAKLENSSDFEIFLFARENNFAIVTFDVDFVDLNAMHGTPPKIIYLNTGNLSTKNVAELIVSHLIVLKNYLDSDLNNILELIDNK